MQENEKKAYEDIPSIPNVVEHMAETVEAVRALERLCDSFNVVLLSFS